MKILFFSYKFFPDVGGIEVNSEILANYFVEFGADVKLVTTSSSDDVNEENFLFQVYRNPNISQLFKLFNWADIVYENNPCLSLAYPQIFFRKKHVIALRTWVSRLDGSQALPDKLKKKWLLKADKIIAVSEEVRLRTFKDAVVIGNPYRASLFVNLNIQKTRDFVFLGRVVSDKGADMCIELIRKFSTEDNFKNRRSFGLTIIGEGEDLIKLKALVNKLGLKDYVRFTGILRGEELVKELNKHFYLLAPSRWREPFGNVALEGMASGCLPIVSDGGGLVDAVGNAGIIFKRNNDQDFYEKISYLLQNSDYENEVRANFTNHLENHKPQNVAKRYYQVIKDVYE
ncbi:glycosyltransferase family 4 protein [Zunongwangia profunda]|uniref:glycosyltransferase family 4 protein n=1 Tax=Zunongwangia profunda TaxID=398743 RepID=UPI001D185038|nr:glycosyltransferase family 4 protein [Zunongwangia profunda]MCC4227316.1 glycosyltransferase family 4 protein [Zunongwangia profunda]